MIDPDRNLSTRDELTAIQPQPPNVQRKPANPLFNYQFSSEELRVLRECNNESFFQRSVPIGTAMSLATYFAVKNGYLKPNAKFGAIPKVVVAITVGYFAGKFSYQQKCAEKLMQLPNSKLAEIIRQRRKGGFAENLDPSFGAGMSLTPFSSAGPGDVYSDAGSQSGFEYDGYHTSSDLDDSRKPSDNNMLEDELPPKQDTFTTYDALRNKNREEYYRSKSPGYVPKPEVPAKAPRVMRSTDEEESPLSMKRRTKYGDEME